MGRKLSDAILEDMLTRIGSGELAEGDGLPAETALAATYGVSRSVAREAVRALAAKGFVVASQGATTVVAPRYRWQVLDPEFLAVNSGADFFAFLQEAREHLEPLLARLAADRVGDQDVEAMRLLTDELERAGDDPERHADLDIAFHSMIAAATGNPVLVSVHDSISNMGRRSRTAALDVPGAVDRAAAWHRHLVDALEARDGAAAEAAMRMHMRQVRTELEAVHTARGAAEA